VFLEHAVKYKRIRFLLKVIRLNYFEKVTGWKRGNGKRETGNRRPETGRGWKGDRVEGGKGER